MPDDQRVIIFDTTLRDGEQSPGISLNATEKLEIARQLARLGVDVIEAGFPIASPGDFDAVEAIAREVDGPVIAGLARAHASDVEAAWRAVRDAGRPRVHVFLSTSDIHIEHQLLSTREDVRRQARAAVAHARSLCEDVEFSPMDATRADVEFTAEVIAIALEEDDQHPRHRRLHDARRVQGIPRPALRARPGAAGRRPLGPLP
jgi:2-isopropylmalate synthase